LGVAAYLLYMLVHVSTTDQVKACQLAIHNTSAQDQCTGLLKVKLMCPVSYSFKLTI
jgi:hypothetical protein